MVDIIEEHRLVELAIEFDLQEEQELIRNLQAQPNHLRSRRADLTGLAKLLCF